MATCNWNCGYLSITKTFSIADPWYNLATFYLWFINSNTAALVNETLFIWNLFSGKTHVRAPEIRIDMYQISVSKWVSWQFCYNFYFSKKHIMAPHWYCHCGEWLEPQSMFISRIYRKKTKPTQLFHNYYCFIIFWNSLYVSISLDSKYNCFWRNH